MHGHRFATFGLSGVFGVHKHEVFLGEETRCDK